MSAGINLRSFLEDMVPLHEEHAARLERGIRIREWMEMDYWEKVLIVAHRRISAAIRNLQEDAQIEEMERKTKRGPRK